VLLVHSEIYYVPIGDGWEEVLVRNVSHYVPILLLGTRYRPAFSTCDGGSPSLNIFYGGWLFHVSSLPSVASSHTHAQLHSLPSFQYVFSLLLTIVNSLYVPGSKEFGSILVQPPPILLARKQRIFN
jgi:hypothetical protein